MNNRCWPVVLLVCAASCLWSADAPHVRNFAEVNQHLYRGAEPGEAGLKDLATIHVNLDLDLREAGAATEAEHREAQALGMQYLNVPLPALGTPNPDAIRRVLALLVPDDAGTIFVHCRRGKDRTGTVIACYRIQHDGWSPQRALEEAREHGMSHLEYGMRRFVLSFQPIDLKPAVR